MGNKSKHGRTEKWHRARTLIAPQGWRGMQPTRGHARVGLPMDERGRKVVVLAGEVVWDSARRGTYRKPRPITSGPAW